MKLKEWTQYFFLSLFLLALFSWNSHNTIKERAPNIVLIMADDCSYSYCGILWRCRGKNDDDGSTGAGRHLMVTYAISEYPETYGGAALSTH
jgi:hypothetical protein|tara:strand:+ start:793 stop:1068 length:276 start_codon:yes stop_codon:yes gene_type:complete